MQEAAAAIAERLESRARARGGLSALKERRDLEPEFVSVLEARYPGVVEKDRKVEIPGWPGVGNVDILVRKKPGGPELRLAVELKWGADDKVQETIWDVFKMALLATRGDADAVYLAAGASLQSWEQSGCGDLFETGALVSLELCSRRFATGSRRLIWDYLLAGGYDRFPSWVPAEVRTDAVAAVAMTAGRERWELRVVKLTPVGTDGLEFRDGWPNGARPPDARHPLAPDPSG